MSNETQKAANPTRRDDALSRRQVIKVAIATAPVIATLPSGAALARSSNVITSSLEGGAHDASGNTLCLADSSGAVDPPPPAFGTSIDLGTSPNLSVTVIPQRDYRVDSKGSAAAITEGAMCQQGGSFYYQSAGWQQVNVPQGILVSATALSSFAGHITTTNV